MTITPKDDRPPWSMQRILDAWRAVEIGTSKDFRLDYPTVARGKEAGDDEVEAHRYVASLPCYDRARPVIVWRIVDDRSLREFRVVQAGETIPEALRRLQWTDLLIYPPSDTLLVAVEDMAWWRYRAFKMELRREVQVNPYRGRSRMDLVSCVHVRTNLSVPAKGIVDSFGRVW